jgi:hypothetical protein
MTDLSQHRCNHLGLSFIYFWLKTEGDRNAPAPGGHGTVRVRAAERAHLLKWQSQLYYGDMQQVAVL